MLPAVPVGPISAARVQLASSRLAVTNNALYQTISRLIDAAEANADGINSASGVINTATGGGGGGGGLGNVVGPAGVVDGQIALYDGTTGKLIKASSGDGNVEVVGGVYTVVTRPDILVASGIINNVGIKSLRSTPVTAIIAPGLRKMIVPRCVRFAIETQFGAYTNIITAGGTNAWFGFRVAPAFAPLWPNVVDDTTLGANITAGAPLPDNVLPGYDPQAFTGIFGVATQHLIQFESSFYRDYSNRWGFINYGYGGNAFNQPLQILMGADGAGTDLTGGGAGNYIDWYIEYQIVTFQ